MPGFDSGEQPGVAASLPTPDFKASLDAYYKQVETLGVKIKAANSELEGILTAISEAKSDLQAQYNRKVDSLGGEANALLLKVADLQSLSASLDQQIKEKQATKDSISLDNTAEQDRLRDEWRALNKSSEELGVYEKELALKNDQLLARQNKLSSDINSFESYKATELKAMAEEAKVAVALKSEAEVAKNDAAIILQNANDAIAKASQDKASLDLQVADANAILAKADEVKKQADANVEALKINSAQAFQNDKDANEIRVARVALNNLKQELNAREQMVALAEKNIGGK